VWGDSIKNFICRFVDSFTREKFVWARLRQNFWGEAFFAVYILKKILRAKLNSPPFNSSKKLSHAFE